MVTNVRRVKKVIVYGILFKSQILDYFKKIILKFVTAEDLNKMP